MGVGTPRPSPHHHTPVQLDLVRPFTPAPTPSPLDAPARSTTSHISACILPDGHQSTRLLEKSGSFGDLQVLLASLPHPPLTPPNTQRATYTHDAENRAHTQMKTHAHTAHTRASTPTHTHTPTLVRARSNTHAYTRIFKLATY